jgi:serine/threonine protein kinase
VTAPRNCLISRHPPGGVSVAQPGFVDRSERIGAYRVTDLLATGATSSVLAAVAEGPFGFTRTVALKSLRGDAARSPEHVRDFLHEARAAACLDHPHIAQIHALVEERDRHFMVMELVRGWSVRALTATLSLTRRRAAFEIASMLVRDAALAVHALHDVGVLHRNLSPDNLLVSAGGHLKVIDFGAASWELLDQVRARPAPALDVAYAAPETGLGLRADRPCDVYSLGAVLHELVTGAPPPAGAGWPRWRGGGGPNAAVALADDDELPAGLGIVIDRALRYAPQERYATAAEFAAALDDVADLHSWRVRNADVAAYLTRTFTTRVALPRAPRRRPEAELGKTRVRLRRYGT